DDGLVDANAVILIAGSSAQPPNIYELAKPLLIGWYLGYAACSTGTPHHHSTKLCILLFRALQKRKHVFDLISAQLRTLGKISALVLPTLPEERFHALPTEAIIFVQSPQNGEASARVLGSTNAQSFEQSVKQRSAADFNHVVAALDAQRLHGVRRQHA